MQPTTILNGKLVAIPTGMLKCAFCKYCSHGSRCNLSLLTKQDEAVLMPRLYFTERQPEFQQCPWTSCELECTQGR